MNQQCTRKCCTIYSSTFVLQSHCFVEQILSPLYESTVYKAPLYETQFKCFIQRCQRSTRYYCIIFCLCNERLGGYFFVVAFLPIHAADTIAFYRSRVGVDGPRLLRSIFNKNRTQIHECFYNTFNIISQLSYLNFLQLGPVIETNYSVSMDK